MLDEFGVSRRACLLCSCVGDGVAGSCGSYFSSFIVFWLMFLISAFIASYKTFKFGSLFRVAHVGTWIL